MGRPKTLDALILGDEGILFQGACSALFVPSNRDTIAIMPEHTPLIMMLGPGEVKAVAKRDLLFKVQVTSGVLYVADNQASVLINA